MKLKFSYQAAESIMRKRAASFYAAFSDLERSKFLDIAAIYAFCRHADDLADNSKRTDASATLKALDDLEEQIHGIYEGEGSEELCKYDWWKAFENAVKSRHIKIRPLRIRSTGREAMFSSGRLKRWRSLHSIAEKSQELSD